MRTVLGIVLLACLASPRAVTAAQDADKCARCGNSSYGTAVRWSGSPSDAAAKAKAEGKLVFVLHVSGHFEDPRFT
jgi:hypothetical protein